MSDQRVLDLPDPYSSVSGEAVEHLGDVLQRRPMSRIRDGDVELPQPFDRLEVVRDTPRVFGDPRGITPSQKHVPRKQRTPLGPVKAQVIRGVTGRVNRHELPLVGLDRIAIDQQVADVLDPLGTPHRGTDRIRQKSFLLKCTWSYMGKLISKHSRFRWGSSCRWITRIPFNASL